MTSRTGSVRGGFWRFEKKSVELSFSVQGTRLTFGARRREANLRPMRAARDGGQMIPFREKNEHFNDSWHKTWDLPQTLYTND